MKIIFLDDLAKESSSIFLSHLRSITWNIAF